MKRASRLYATSPMEELANSVGAEQYEAIRDLDAYFRLFNNVQPKTFKKELEVLHTLLKSDIFADGNNNQ